MFEKPIRVAIADDHTLFRKGLMMMVGGFDKVEVIADFPNGKEALNFLKQNPIDIILLDLDMPVLDGWETSRKIIAKYPNIHIIIISMNDSLEVIAELIEIGVHSYLLKNAEPNEVKRAIHSVLNNDFYYNHVVSKALRQNIQRLNFKKPTHQDQAHLTKREVEVLELICKEMTVKEIGEELHLSEQTIQTYRKHMMKKIHGKNGVSLVRYAIQNQIVSF